MADFDELRQKLSQKTHAGAVPGAPTLVVNHEIYEAFGSKDRLRRLDLRASDGLSHALPYSHLLLLTYNRRTYGEIFLTISGMAATIKGRNLRPIVDALKLHTCEFIQAYDPLEFGQPVDLSAPFVDSVEVEIIGSTRTRKEG